MTNGRRIVVACWAPLLRVQQDVGVGVHAELVGPDGPVGALADPGGGLFNAAGDFDRLLPASEPAGGCLSRVDPYGSTSFEPAEMDVLVDEVDRLILLAKEGPERRGLLRLRALAVECRSRPGSWLKFLGD